VKLSAGLVPYRFRPQLEVLIAHPGGPLWARRDAGHWSIVKGEVAPDEDARAAAGREFTEETGWLPPPPPWLDLGSVRLKSGKAVTAWAAEGDFSVDTLNPGTFEMVWRGRRQSFPEIDRVAWCLPPEARRLLNPAQGALIARLTELLADGSQAR
jgi:predicted NUDIX family NTP pyrophosphohydrolase